MMRSLLSRAWGLGEGLLVLGGRRPLSHTHLPSTSLFLKATTASPSSSLLIQRTAHTKAKGDEELISFLSEEIATEKKGARAVGATLEGFEVRGRESEVELVRVVGGEKVTVSFNVNHSVDAEAGEEAAAEAGKAGEGKDPEMRSRPNFEVEIRKGDRILSFSCSFMQETAEVEAGQEDYQDAFVIDEVSVFEGEFKEETYAVAGDILDGYLYDLFMNLLEERGVTSEFVEKMSDFATDYEHKLYVNFLTKLQDFVSAK